MDMKLKVAEYIAQAAQQSFRPCFSLWREKHSADSVIRCRCPTYNPALFLKA